MRRHGHSAEQIRLCAWVGLTHHIRAFSRVRSCGLGLVEGQRQLVDREALAPCTEVLMAGQSDLLEQLFDEQRLLLKLLLLLKDQCA